ncbi:MAG: hypothetical protein CVV27_09220 [Candidatus Melainabacteria bacterium HGW-Melainabacteria-1]|nr:MAG: hypothetical protein CVV27_09220 [Candidatus Melainabacteria bacterium HGW-Melainabacteria-1]
MSEERKLILKMVQENRISVDEAEQLLSALDGGGQRSGTGSAKSTDGEKSSAGRESGPTNSVFDKAKPQVEQMMGTLSSMFETVSQQLGPNIEKRVEGWFQQRAGRETGPEAPPAETRTQEETIPVESGSQQLRCLHRLGDLKVEGYEGSQIQATLEKRIHSSRFEDRQKFEAVRLISRQDGPVLHLELSGTDGLKANEISISLRLKVPTSLDLDLRTESHDIVLSQLSRTQGQARLESESGNLELRNIALKRLDLQTRSGNVLADQASELIVIQTASGDIKLKGSVYEAQVGTQSGNVTVEAGINHLLKLESRSSDLNVQLLDGRGRLELRSGSGDIELTGQIQSELEIQTASGDLHCDLSLSAQGSANLGTQSGDVDLILRPGSDCKLQADASSGDIECRVKLEQTEQSEHALRGVLGSGAGQLRIQTQSGDVLIS